VCAEVANPKWCSAVTTWAKTSRPRCSTRRQGRVRPCLTSGPEALLVTGVYGAGKRTIVADMGSMLESWGEPYGALDVDSLAWFGAGLDREAHDRVVLGNVASVCRACVAVRVRHLALAWWVADRGQLEALRAAVAVPLRVVRLEVDAALVQQRLRADPTQERRQDDVATGLRRLEERRGEGLEELALLGDRPVRETSEAVCRWLGWA
jgi:hypothetical protein